MATAVGARHARRTWTWTLLALLAVAWSPGLRAQSPDAGEASQSVTLPAARGSAAPADVYLGNRRILTLRATNEFGADPAERARGIESRLAQQLQRGGPLIVTVQDMGSHVALLVDEQPLFRVLPGDIDREADETPQKLARDAARNLQVALRERREARDSEAMLLATGKSVLATVVLLAALWAVAWVYRRMAGALRRFAERRSAAMVPAWGQQVVASTTIAEVVVAPLKLLMWAIVLLLLYQWTALVLAFYPYTRPWGETLGRNLVDALATFGQAALRAVPGLLFVVLIFVLTRFVVRLVRAFFDGVQSGRIEVGWIDDATARPTGRLITAVIWLFAFVAAYPYLPGSGSEAFKGIGVFVGLMLSIGASGVVNQAVSGLMLMYTKALRPGEFVQIGETEGTVTSVGFLTTRIETLRNVEVSIPNAVIAGNVTRNFSRLATRGGVRVPTSVTIGYDTPWRQVQAMLQLAASRTEGLASEPPPRVLQTALQDFYVEYTLIVSVADPRQRPTVLNELHGHIQDVFNEHGVQIMSPNYEADPDDKKIVPREQWYAAPASPTAAARSSAAVDDA
ncbi:MAG TPA: mechanosensitive ion channel family protein [Steroidobacteraceae bacterium]|nr:mechanosensitive ion channel family protein [Steroidobacteraceae bacterium]